MRKKLFKQLYWRRLLKIASSISFPLLILFYNMNQNSEQGIREYRNGIYQGSYKQGKRHGKGILITDNGQIIVGTWKNDLLIGKVFIQFNQDEYGFGDFNRGQIQGQFLFRRRQQVLFGQFNSSRPINELLLINNQKKTAKLLAYKGAIYQVLSETGISNMDEQQVILKNFRIKTACPPLLDFLYEQFCKDSTFIIHTLPNGNCLFTWNDNCSPVTAGIVFTKNGNLVSYGTYYHNKLMGIGCKYQNNVRYEGQFANGFISGIGLKYMKGKYSFGKFQQGNLIDAIILQDRTPLSEQKLQEIKKLTHIQSLNYWNGYIKSDLIKFKGFKQINLQKEQKQQYLYPKSQIKTKSKNIALDLLNNNQYQTRSVRQNLYSQFKNPQEQQSQRSIKTYGNNNLLSSLRKFNNRG